MVNPIVLAARLAAVAAGPATAAAAVSRPEPRSGLQDAALAIIIGLAGLALIMVVVRSTVRLRAKQFGLDDWLISFAMAISVGETFIAYKVIKTSFIGIPGKEIPPNVNMTEALIWEYLVTIFYNPILGLTKASVLVFLLRLFGKKDGVRTYIYVLFIVNMLHMVITLFAIIFQCYPIPFNWDPTVGGGMCLDKRLLFTVTSSITLLTDLLVLALPAYIFVGLKIPRRTKIALLFVFLLGFAATVAGAVRLALLVQGLFHLVELPDPSYNIGFVTSGIETHLAVITACVPALTPLLRSWFPSLFGQDAAGPAATREPRLALHDMRSRVELRGQTPRKSEEEAMTYNGIVKQSQLESRYGSSTDQWPGGRF